MNAHGSFVTLGDSLGGLAGGGSPSWSSDGSRIAFRSDRDENPAIYVVKVEAAERPTPTTTQAASGRTAQRYRWRTLKMEGCTPHALATGARRREQEESTRLPESEGCGAR